MTQKPPSAKPETNPADKPAPASTPQQDQPKKKLSLDISDVSEVLERKISP